MTDLFMTDLKDLQSRDTFYWLCQLDKASTVMTVEEGIAPRDVGVRTAAAIAKVISDAAAPGAERPTDYLQVEPLVRKLVGPDSSRIHSGRSRQDMLPTVYRLLLRDRLVLVHRALGELRAGLLAAAERYGSAIVPAYTNGVQAQPTTFGHLLLGYEATLGRSATRLAEAYSRLNLCPLGAAALATSSFPVNRGRLAELLGFDAPVQNSFDAAQLSVIDVGFEVASSVMALALSIGTFIQDVHAQYHHARPWITLDNTDLLSPSTLMPQKRNPVALNRARLLASEVIGDGVSTALAAHNVCSGLTDYKRAEAQRTLDRTIALLGEVNAIVGGMRLDEQAALAEVRSDYSTTSELANVLQRDADVPFHVGHRFASALVTYGRGGGLTVDQLDFAEALRLYREIAGEFSGVSDELPMTEAQFRAALDPVSMVASYRGLGGPQPAEFQRLLAAAQEGLRADELWLGAVAGRLSAAQDAMEADFAALAG
ncbi:lyase family protein [Kitasatospora kifunensis]|uniref:argininosuccinate lyase n=1 Tax=Kitasatospora kifunensis TaxID=58351 RepID=A0A7W7VVT8_KITKI|nr:lyase family protein [Kitasatospora kifunensis]MBB4924044.1 argininosuccinate lyase [Kitasatospora kifunensis]